MHQPAGRIGGLAVKYLCLVYLDKEHWNACSDPECADCVQQLVAGKRLVAAERAGRFTPSDRLRMGLASKATRSTKATPRCTASPSAIPWLQATGSH